MSTVAATNHYNPESFLITRFVNHMSLGLKKDIGSRDTCPKNALEKIGDVGLWFIEEFPRKIWRTAKDPRVVTVALTVLALVGTSFAFYPATTLMVLGYTAKLLPFTLTYPAIKFAAYLFVVETILAHSCRAQGRFWNEHLMDEFYRAHH